MLYYLYTDQAPSVEYNECLGIIELANRYNKTSFYYILLYKYIQYCPLPISPFSWNRLKNEDILVKWIINNPDFRLVLPRLITLVEKDVIDQLTDVIEAGGDVVETVLKIVQPAQVHNAHQLSHWCLSYLALNYNSACRR